AAACGAAVSGGPVDRQPVRCTPRRRGSARLSAGGGPRHAPGGRCAGGRPAGADRLGALSARQHSDPPAPGSARRWPRAAGAAPGPQATRILGEAGMQPPPEVREPIGATPPGLDNAPPRSRWPGRLLRLVLVTVLGVALWEWGQWSWSAWQWHPVAGAMLGGLGAVLAGTGPKAWADVRRQRARLTEVEQLRLELQAALADPRERLALDWLDRLQALYEDTPLAAQMNAACADLDQSYSAD